jgi:hypothetical protein
MGLSTRDLVSQMIIGNSTVPFLILMKPNPQNFRINSRKSFSESQTLASFVYEHWGNRPDVIQCVGWTQRKVGSDAEYALVDFQILKLQQIFKIDKERMVSFLKMFNKNNLPTGTTAANLNSGDKSIQDQITGKKNQSLKDLGQSFIVYRYTLYLGFFTSFAWSEQNDRPRLYDYSFEFVVTFSSTDYIARQLLVNFPDAAKIGLMGAVSSISQAPGLLTLGKAT